MPGFKTIEDNTPKLSKMLADLNNNQLPQMPRKPIISGIAAMLVVLVIVLVTCNA